jgi:hypothetical protein
VKREVGNACFPTRCGKGFLNIRVPRTAIRICKNIFGVTVESIIILTIWNDLAQWGWAPVSKVMRLRMRMQIDDASVVERANSSIDDE